MQQENQAKNTVLCVVGPTACGKTKMGVLLAKSLGGEVVSVDSMQIYRGMTIGTAAPTAAEMDGVPHHMVAVADPAEQWSVARFVHTADGCVQDILQRGRLPVLVGGTGLYLDALIAGRDFAAGQAGGEIRKALEERLQSEGIEPLLEELRAVDPDTAQRLSPADHKRILRALEVFRETGKPISQHNAESRQKPGKYRPLYIGLAFRNREDMKALIDRRVDEMVRAGLREEAEALLRAGLPPGSTALQAIGYKECLQWLRGEASFEAAVEEIKLRSRQYAKRQLTWLRRNPDIHWIYWDKERDFDKALQEATEILSALGVG